VDGIELIPAAVRVAREIARDRHLDIHYQVMDVTELPHAGIQYDLIVDSYCLQSIVLDADRGKVFAAVRARLRPCGYYLISTAMYAPHRHHPGCRIVDAASGNVFHRYDEHDLYDPDTEIVYSPVSQVWLDQLEGLAQYVQGRVSINGQPYLPHRRHRTAQSLRAELEAQGFSVLVQTGEYGQNVACNK
jgi:SAM-dependent methyltransferase